jgi:hypothetical protein
VSKRRAEQKQMRRYFEQGKALHVPGKKLKPNNVVVFEKGKAPVAIERHETRAA